MTETLPSDTTSARWRKLFDLDRYQLLEVVHALPWMCAEEERGFVLYVNELRNAVLLYEAAAQSALDVVKSPRTRATLLTALGLDSMYLLQGGRHAAAARVARFRVVARFKAEALRAELRAREAAAP